jgi:hypothetical protein
MELSGLVINGISLLAIIFGLVESAKRLGVKGNQLTWLSMGVGVVLCICYQVAQMYQVFNVWFAVIVFGLAGGLAATGIYDFANVRWPKVATPPSRWDGDGVQ